MATVQVATLEDIPELVDLLHILFTQESDFVPDRENQQKGLSVIVSNENIGHILVLKESEKVIGMVNILYTVSTALGGKVAIMEDMILHPDYRNQGKGSFLLKEAIDFANKKGCKRITLLADITNTDAIKFYKKHGFIQSEMTPLRLTF